MTKTIDDLQYDATMLVGMIDGIASLWDNTDGMARNAMTPIIEQARQMASNLADNLDITGCASDATIQAAPSTPQAKPAHNEIMASLYKAMSLVDLGVAACDDSVAPTVHTQAGCAAQFEAIGSIVRETVDHLEKTEIRGHMEA